MREIWLLSITVLSSLAYGTECFYEEIDGTQTFWMISFQV
jgi:hypothetical protein